jgi:hypothetical protein
MFGSGESQASAKKTHAFVAERLPHQPRIELLETPAGFEPNSATVAGKIAHFLEGTLQNHEPQTNLIPARKRGSIHSPDDPALVAPLLSADWIFLGPGSPTYATRQLRDSVAYQMLQARHRLGATLMLASAATVSFCGHTMPIYEIYKVGEDLHWKPGLDFFAPFGLHVIIVPHWNNTDGGDELDTSRCYLGKTRFDALVGMLNKPHTIIGLDEHTALIIDPVNEVCHVNGKGNVTVVRDGVEKSFPAGTDFSVTELGEWRIPAGDEGIPAEIWAQALDAHAAKNAEPETEGPPEDVLALVQQRTEARTNRDWAAADELRDAISERGWQVKDTPEGAVVTPLN